MPRWMPHKAAGFTSALHVAEQAHEGLADGQRFRPVLQAHRAAAAVVADDAGDRLQVDDGGAVDLLEVRGVQPRQQFLEGNGQLLAAQTRTPQLV